MRLVFMVEERSMKELLNVILPKILPGDVETLIIKHDGKSDLQASIPRKLRAWPFPSDKFIIVHDQDSNDCKRLKNDLISLCENSGYEYLIRIVCVELESWYFGDLRAVSRAYGEGYAKLSAKRKYREPDKLANAKEELRKLVPTYQPVFGAEKIAPYMDVDRNISHSFNIFVNGVRKMC